MYVTCWRKEGTWTILKLLNYQDKTYPFKGAVSENLAKLKRRKLPSEPNIKITAGNIERKAQKKAGTAKIDKN